MREHEFWQQPQPFAGKPRPMPVPDAWQDEFPGKTTIDLIPLVDGAYDGGPGWCTYPWGFESPEVEVFCGGQNEKTVTAAAVWRQGFLVHFGFEQGPRQLNEVGDDLLVRTIVYAARCGGDRPVTRLVSPFRGGKRMLMPREKARSGLAGKEAAATWFAATLADELLAVDGEARQQRFATLLPFLVTNGDNRLEVDAALRAFGVGNRDVAFFARCEQALAAGGADADTARALLARYVPDGPRATAAAAAWTKWIAEHRDCVYFSDVGGYRWFVDPLAKARGVPTAQWRGARRVAAPR